MRHWVLAAAIGCVGLFGACSTTGIAEPAAVTGDCRYGFVDYNNALASNDGIGEKRFKNAAIENCSHDEWIAVAREFPEVVNRYPAAVSDGDYEAALQALCEITPDAKACE